MLRSTFSTTTMASSTTMPIASTSPNSDSVLIEKPNSVQHREGADDRDRHRHQRDDRGAPGLQEENDHEDDQRDGLEQRLDDLVDRVAHELGRVVDDLVVDALGHGGLQLGHGLAHVVGDRRGRSSRAPGRWPWRPPACCRAASAANSSPAPSSMRATSREARDLAVRAGLDDDVAELLLGLQPAAGIDGQLKVDLPACRATAPTTPAATCTFCSRIASTTSLAESPRAATFCGSSQTRMA